jgi:hypothetical protein
MQTRLRQSLVLQNVQSVKPLVGGARAVLFLNRGETPGTIGVKWGALGYPVRLEATATDLWTGGVFGRQSGGLTRTVRPYSVVMLRIEP